MNSITDSEYISPKFFDRFQIPPTSTSLSAILYVESFNEQEWLQQTKRTLLHLHYSLKDKTHREHIETLIQWMLLYPETKEDTAYVKAKFDLLLDSIAFEDIIVHAIAILEFSRYMLRFYRQEDEAEKGFDILDTPRKNVVFNMHTGPIDPSDFVGRHIIEASVFVLKEIPKTGISDRIDELIETIVLTCIELAELKVCARHDYEPEIILLYGFRFLRNASQKMQDKILQFCERKASFYEKNDCAIFAEHFAGARDELESNRPYCI